MQIIEEYLKRHNLDVPLTKHVTSGFIFERVSVEPKKYQWKLHLIKWIERSHTVGAYLMMPYYPVSNIFVTDDYKYSDPDNKIPVYFRLDQNYSYLMKNNKPGKSEIEIEWDNYEDYLKDNFKEVLDRLVFDDEEVTIFLWEVFVSAYDGFFAHINAANSQAFVDSLNVEKSIQERYQAYKNYLNNSDISGYSVFKCWSNDLSSFLKKNCMWLKNVLHSAS